MPDQNALQSILEELRKLNKLTGISVTQGRSPGEKISLLSQAGLTPKEIADTLGIKPNLVSVTLYNERKKQTPKKGNKAPIKIMKEGKSKSDNELLQEISSKLSELIAINGIAGKEKTEQIKYLLHYDFSNSEIARIIGIPKGTVDGIRAGLNKKK